MGDFLNAPIAIFAYRRTDHLARTLDALERCPEFADHQVYVYSDGPKNAASMGDVQAVRKLIHSRLRPNMSLVARDENLGLANSIIGAVTDLCDRFGAVIVIEDDLVLQPAALAWFQSALDQFKDDNRVMHIGGYQYAIREFSELREGVFQRFTTSWGWATWKRAWDQFDFAASGWEELNVNPPLERAFNAGGAYPFAPMLRKQMRGELDSWAIRWWWTVFKANGLALMPPKSLVTNIGFDSSATHNSIGFAKALLSGPRPALWEIASAPSIPKAVTLTPSDEHAFRHGLTRTNAMRNHKIKRVLEAMGLRRFRT